jgi:enterochelin esterase-like enzyme
MKTVRILILLVTLSACSTVEKEPILFKEIRTPSKSLSRMITEWTRLNDINLQKQADSFLLYHKDFPLVEIDTLYRDYLYVTFIYRDTSKNAEISFDIFGNYDDKNLGDKKLKKLRSTGLYFRSYYMPCDICFSYRFVINDTVSKTSRTVTDPLNNARIPYGELKSFSWSVLDLRQNEEVWNSKKYTDVTSQLINFDLTSSILKNTRKIYVYLPEGYDRNKPGGYPVIYLFDSFIYLNRIEVPNVLDNLVRAEKTDPMIAVLIDNPSPESREKELPLNFDFKDFVVKELVPRIKSEWNITSDPQKTIIGGMSYGGLAAGFISFYTDSIFGRVLSQSGSFWRDTVCEPLSSQWSRTDWLISQYQAKPKKNIKIYLDWGLQEPIILNSNRKFVRVLDTLGYDFKYTEFNGWHDWSNSRKTFPAGLMYLMRNK